MRRQMFKCSCVLRFAINFSRLFVAQMSREFEPVLLIDTSPHVVSTILFRFARGSKKISICMRKRVLPRRVEC